MRCHAVAEGEIAPVLPDDGERVKLEEQGGNAAPLCAFKLKASFTERGSIDTFGHGLSRESSYI